MFGRWVRGSGTAVRALVVLAAVCCCLAAAAYAATKPGHGSGSAKGQGTSTPLQPRYTDFPPATTEERRAEISFVQPPRPPARARPGTPPTHECRLDDEDWRECDSPTTRGGLSVGRHTFAVRAVSTAGRAGPAAARAWRVTKRQPPQADPAPDPPVAQPSAPAPPVAPPVVPPEEKEEPQPPAEKLRVEADTSGLLPLLPGSPAQALPLTIVNDADEPAIVTSLEVTVTSPVEDCGEVNFEVIQSPLSTTLPLEVPAEGSAALPVSGIPAPQLLMRALPVDQDPCQGVQLLLHFDIEATE
jgi:hypothetical protein